MRSQRPEIDEVLCPIAFDRCRAVAPFVLLAVVGALVASGPLGIPLTVPAIVCNVGGIALLLVIVVAVGTRRLPVRYAHVAMALVWVEAVGGTLISMYVTHSPDLANVVLIEMLGLAIMLDTRFVISLMLALDAIALPLIVDYAGKQTGVYLISIGCAQTFTLISHVLQRRAFLQMAALRRAERRSADERQRLQDQLLHAQRMDAIGTLASGLAHDMNNVLASITSLAELVREQPSAPTVRADLERLLGQTGRGAALTRGLLAFSRRAGMKKRVLHIDDLVSETIALLSRTLPKNVEIEAHVATEDARVEGDFGQLQQVIVNLGVNAADAMAEQTAGRIRIATSTRRLEAEAQMLGVTPGEYVEILFVDSGCGMDDDTRKRAFEPFFTTKPLGKGTGLGLSTAWGITQGHGGTITIESTRGAGTTFRVYLPTTKKSSRPLERTHARARTNDGWTVLVVDDEEAVRATTMRLLGRRGMRVLGAANGEEALEVFRQHADTISLVILDMGMPVMGGRECFQRLRLMSQVPVLVVTGYALEEDAQTLLAHGVALLEKPFGSERLMREVTRLLDTATAQAG
ncbi:MAG TPA: ATP-binding protein [Kofleriaceae bacterium]|nr:ATP-binding protein [Kofleriaceae bacterium]